MMLFFNGVTKFFTHVKKKTFSASLGLGRGRESNFVV